MHHTQIGVLTFYAEVVFVLFMLGLNGPFNNKVCRAGQLIVVLFLGRLRSSMRLTSTKRGRPQQ